MRELAEMYPIASAQIKEDMKQKGYDPQIPHWDLFEINDQVHRLQSIFRNRLDFLFDAKFPEEDLVALILLLHSKVYLSLESVKYEILADGRLQPNYTKSVIVSLIDDRYCQLMAEFAQFCNYK